MSECKDCKWWENEDYQYFKKEFSTATAPGGICEGKCKRHSPIPEFPSVGPDEWCGDFEEKENQ